jgi:hypothetical protein
LKLFSALIWLSLSLICNPNIRRQNQNWKVGGGGDGCEAIYEGLMMTHC